MGNVWVITVPYTFSTLDDWLDDVLVLPPDCGDEGGEDLTDVRDDAECEGDANDGEQDAEHSAGSGHWGNVAITWNRGQKYRTIELRFMTRSRLFPGILALLFGSLRIICQSRWSNLIWIYKCCHRFLPKIVNFSKNYKNIRFKTGSQFFCSRCDIVIELIKKLAL